MDSLARKFGPDPIHEVPNGLLILCLQWILSVTILIITSPPFAVDDYGGCRIVNILFIASVATLATVCMHWGQLDPVDTFMTSGKILYRTCQ